MNMNQAANGRVIKFIAKNLWRRRADTYWAVINYGVLDYAARFSLLIPTGT
jgi:hypothetical protein